LLQIHHLRHQKMSGSDTAPSNDLPLCIQTSHFLPGMKKRCLLARVLKVECKATKAKVQVVQPSNSLNWLEWMWVSVDKHSVHRH
jgi:hypothetical protein